MVDSVDLGSSVFDVQVRVLSSAPEKKKSSQLGWLFLFSFARFRTRTHLNATRMSVAADGLTEANLNVCQRQTCKSSPVIRTIRVVITDFVMTTLFLTYFMNIRIITDTVNAAVASFAVLFIASICRLYKFG